MNIVIANRQRTKKINSRLLKRIIAALFEDLKIEGAELGINVVGAKEMAQVNWNFLRHEGSTDVITFDHAEKRKQIYGELFVCADDAVRQAKEFQTGWQSEIVRYIVHGILHLLGHDDVNAKAKRKMKAEENRLLRKLSARFALSRL
ncbi:MAG TPA: rRNA maturation RNase YbeY [Verrucomicrobiae bacterium]|jgi:probable rRNA maturation factor|nr:rRNA maturation RNase YbeY [Verrucomicrobiae bacterium]